MNEPVKLLFDECVGAPVAEHFGLFLKGIYPEPHEVRHCLDFQKQGIPDEQWIPEMARNRFMVITADRGKRTNGKKLPLLCVKFAMTHIMFGPSVHDLKSSAKVLALGAVWEKIIAAYHGERGSRFLMTMRGGTHPVINRVAISDAEQKRAARYLQDP